MISDAELNLLASQPRESAEILAQRLRDLRARGAGILQCIKYVKLNQACSLGAAADIVLNSAAWLDRKDDFLRQQQEHLAEFLADNQDKIQSIEQRFTLEGTETIVHMKPRP